MCVLWDGVSMNGMSHSLCAKTEHIEKKPQTYRLTSRDGQVGVHGLFFLLSFFFLLFSNNKNGLFCARKKKGLCGEIFSPQGPSQG